MLGISAHMALKLVENAVVLVQVAQLGAQEVVDLDGTYGLALHVHVPDLKRQVVAADNVAPVRAELDVRDGRNNFREKALGAWVLLLLIDFGMLVAQSGVAHIAQLDDALARTVHENAAVCGVELGGRDYLRQLLHVCGLDVHNIEALVVDGQVPQVDAQIVRRDVCFPVRVQRHGINVVCVSVGENTARGGCHHDLLHLHGWKSDFIAPAIGRQGVGV
mmetsp:Transcript_51447/g.129077  ORF Transcript_51447/g.129077 Transcript_51447/m.129077 type:complete len:219 (-) Transcript_51447:624-1280(-)